jgi:hypothetical protein
MTQDQEDGEWVLDGVGAGTRGQFYADFSRTDARGASRKRVWTRFDKQTGELWLSGYGADYLKAAEAIKAALDAGALDQPGPKGPVAWIGIVFDGDSIPAQYRDRFLYRRRSGLREIRIDGERIRVTVCVVRHRIVELPAVSIRDS